MKTSRSLRLVLLPAAAALAVLFTSCAGPSTKSSVGVAATEYEQVYVLGSYIPVLVPKNSGIRRIHPTSPAVIILREDIQRALGPGHTPLH